MRDCLKNALDMDALSKAGKGITSQDIGDLSMKLEHGIRAHPLGSRSSFRERYQGRASGGCAVLLVAPERSADFTQIKASSDAGAPLDAAPIRVQLHRAGDLSHIPEEICFDASSKIAARPTVARSKKTLTTPSHARTGAEYQHFALPRGRNRFLTVSVTPTDLCRAAREPGDFSNSTAQLRSRAPKAPRLPVSASSLELKAKAATEYRGHRAGRCA